MTGLKVLIVDDNAYMRRIMNTMLKGYGVDIVWEAKDAMSGLAHIIEHKPDIALIDWCLGSEEGIDMVRAVRKVRRPEIAMMPLIIVTSYSQKRRAALARDAGVHDFIVKPIGTHLLYEKLRTLVLEPRPFFKNQSYFGPAPRDLLKRAVA